MKFRDIHKNTESWARAPAYSMELSLNPVPKSKNGHEDTIQYGIQPMGHIPKALTTLLIPISNAFKTGSWRKRIRIPYSYGWTTIIYTFSPSFWHSLPYLIPVVVQSSAVALKRYKKWRIPFLRRRFESGAFFLVAVLFIFLHTCLFWFPNS